MSKQLYLYKKSIIAMTLDDVQSAMVEAERSTRTGKFQTISGGISPQLRTSLKETWPNLLRDWLREKAKAIAGERKIEAEHIRVALEQVLKDEARKRAKDRDGNLAWALRQEIRYYAADLAIALMFQEAPNPAPTSLYRKHKEITVCCKTSEKPGRLVVSCDEADQANVYVFGIFNEELQRIWLLGWAGRKDMKAAPSGSRETDAQNCPWEKHSHYIDFHKLRPMGALLQHLKIKEIPSGILMEQVPSEEIIPAYSRLPSRDPLEPDPGDEFESVIFGNEPATQTSAPQGDTDEIDF